MLELCGQGCTKVPRPKNDSTAGKQTTMLDLIVNCNLVGRRRNILVEDLTWCGFVFRAQLGRNING